MTPAQRAARFSAKKLLDIRMDEARRKRPGSVLLVQDLEACFVEGFTQGFCLGAGVNRQQELLRPEPTEWR